MKGIPILGLVIATLACFKQVAAQPTGLDSLFSQARQFRMNGEFGKSIVAFQECLTLARDKKDTLNAGNALIGIGIINDEEGNFDEALQYYFDALKVYESISNQKKIGGTLKNIGNTYRVLKHYDKAFYFLRQALDVQSKNKDSASVGNVFNDIALVYYDQDSTEKALDVFKMIIADYDGVINSEVRADVRNNIGLTYVKMKRYPQALPYYRSALDIMTARKDQYGIALVLGNTGDLYYRLKDYPRALEYHFRNRDIAKQIRSNELLLSTYDNLKKTYQAIGNFERAYEYTGYEMALKDTVYKKQSIVKYEEMQAKYQYEKGQKEILLLQKDKELGAIEISNQRRTKYFLLAGISLTLLLSALLYKNYRNKRMANKELNRLNAQLGVANSSKAKLISIISHDLRSPISSLFNFLQLQRRNPARLEKEGREELDKRMSESAENLLETMEDLLIWSKSQMDHFTPAVEKVDVDELLNDIISLYQQFAEAKNITLTKQPGISIRFYTDPNFVKIILRNLISNAIKFTPVRGLINLSVRQDNGTILLSVADNGPGLSPMECRNIFEWNSIRSDSSGLGLRLAKEFAEKLGGTLSVSSKPGQGAEFTVTLPLH
jgi:signal transduction histidine kinase